MTHALHSASRSLKSSLCLALIYILLIALFAPFMEPRVQAHPAKEKKSSPATNSKPVIKPKTRRAGELIIRFREGVSESAKNALVAARGASRNKILRGSSRIEKLVLAAGK